MADKIKNFDRSFPCSVALNDLFYGNGFDVERFATVRCADGVFKLRNFFRRHSHNQTPSTHSFQFLFPPRAAEVAAAATARTSVMRAASNENYIATCNLFLAPYR